MGKGVHTDKLVTVAHRAALGRNGVLVFAFLSPFVHGDPTPQVYGC